MHPSHFVRNRKLWLWEVLVVGMLLLGVIAVTSQGGMVSAQGPRPRAGQSVLGTGFTYQGQLKKNANPVNDNNCSMTFSLWDAQGSGSPPSGGTQVGGSQSIPNVIVSNGLFTVLLNGGGQLGANAFTGDERWLQTTVQCTGDGGPTTLSRQLLTAAPYALSLRPGALISGSVAYPGSIISVTNSADGDGLRISTNGNGVHASSDLGLGIYGTSNSSIGVFGRSESDVGVWGSSPLTGVVGSASGVGVYGNVGSSGGTGVSGNSDAGTGVYGRTDSGVGVFGDATANSNLAGVIGQSASAGGYGVLGNNTGGGIGVYGTSSVTGVVGISSGAGSGVYGRNTGGGVGVSGSATGFGIGLKGVSINGRGVLGISSDGAGVDGTSNTNNGVAGSSETSNGVVGGSTYGPGVYGYSRTAFGIGVLAASPVVTGVAFQINTGAIKVSGAGISTTTPVFIWRASISNIGGFNNDSTYIDHPLTNGDPNAILIVTHNYQASSPQIPNNHPIGVWYDSGKWAIFNEDGTSMTAGLAFNVLVIKP